MVGTSPEGRRPVSTGNLSVTDSLRREIVLSCVDNKPTVSDQLLTQTVSRTLQLSKIQIPSGLLIILPLETQWLSKKPLERNLFLIVKCRRNFS